MALERYDDSLDDGRVVAVTLDGDEGALQRAPTVARTDADGTPMHPVFDHDGAIVVIRQPSESVSVVIGQPTVPDPSQSARAETYRTSRESEPIAAVELDGPVLSQRTAGAGRFLLRVFADGTLVADLGNGESFGISDSGYLDAAW